MRLEDIMQKSFEDKISSIYLNKPDITKWLLNHDRKKLCLEKLCTEARKAQLAMGGRFDRGHIEFIAESYAVTFAKAALQHKEEESMHYLEKQRKIEEERQISDIVSAFTSTDSSESL